MDGIIALFNSYTGSLPDKTEEIPCAVSPRRYFRMYLGNRSIIGTWSPDEKETTAFVTYARHFKAQGIHVPEIFSVSEDGHYYLQQDLGSIRMHELVTERKEPALNDQEKKWYVDAIYELVKMQVKGYEGLDFSVAVPRPEFDQRSILWDLNYFKYYFLKPLNIPLDEDKLEDCFAAFSRYIAGLSNDNFMFRDFQTRNIMIYEGSSYFIDFQGGRRGPLQYDIASLLFESKAGLSLNDQQELLELYMEAVGNYRKLDREQFMQDYYLVALIRLLQVLGAYGLRGMVEKKAVFLQSIPKGLQNLKGILEYVNTDITGSYLVDILDKVASTSSRFQSLPSQYDGLTIRIISFSYRESIPDDITGNGGGFVYDCRFLKNPGLKEEFKEQTGLDADVISYLKNETGVDAFEKNITEQLTRVLDSYREKGYIHLMLSFGCTGGRHRSVYMAHTIAEWCRKQPGIRVMEQHRGLNLEF